MDALVHLDLEEALEFQPVEMSEKQWNKKNKLCLGSIRGCLATSVRVNYQHETSAKDLWEKLEKEYLVKKVANRIHLKRNLYRYNMKKGATLTEHLDSYNKLLAELVNYDEKINDEEQALCLINSLPEKYEPVIKALMHGKDKMTYAEVTTALRSEEFRKMDREDLSSEANSDLLLARGRPTDRRKKNGDRGKGKGRSKSRARLQKDECAWCHDLGHWAKDCPKRKDRERDNTEVNIAKASDDSDVASDFSLTVTPSACIVTDGTWVLDSGATYHICPRRDWFSSFEKLDGEVRMGNNHTCRVIGIGSVRIKMHDGMVRELKEVRFVPAVKKNLISLGTLEAKGYKLVAENGILKVISGSLVIMKGTRHHNLYYLTGSTVTGDVSISEHIETAALETT